VYDSRPIIDMIGRLPSSGRHVVETLAATLVMGTA